MRLSITSKIKSIFGINPKPINSNNVNSLSKEFQQSRCKCEQSTFAFMENNYLPKEKFIAPSIYNTINIVEKEMIRPYFLKPEFPISQNSDGQLNMPLKSYIPSIQEVISLVKKESLGNNLGRTFVDTCEHQKVEDVNLNSTTSHSKSYTVNYFVKNNNTFSMKSLRVVK